MLSMAERALAVVVRCGELAITNISHNGCYVPYTLVIQSVAFTLLTTSGRSSCDSVEWFWRLTLQVCELSTCLRSRVSSLSQALPRQWPLGRLHSILTHTKDLCALCGAFSWLQQDPSVIT